ncbi:LysM peptidoglycan-binding domain-containing protein [Geomicrobium sediminis]|uniref:LysM domain-containing protein n=1 Tax=Geomicrobium sediminis TaxID=1347788 RepID=A0ABS2PFD6_9BACL|nr:LysM peptidoglycan-binding domain-containing protein [Geomicrobium sediminis]MBM7633826.1 hypothetical protein [Geomicrobium sediminis]
MKVSLKRGDRAFVLPFNPEQILITNSTRTVNVTPVNYGTVEIARGREPIKVNIQGKLFGEKRNLPKLSDHTADEVKSWLEEWIGARQVRFIITDTDINIPIIIKSFEPRISGGHGDYEYTLDLVEFRDLQVNTFGNAPEVKPEEETSSTTNQQNKTHVVKSGETLWGLATRFYDDGSQYKKIENANRDLIKNPDLIQPGWKLTIPS